MTVKTSRGGLARFDTSVNPVNNMKSLKCNRNRVITQDNFELSNKINYK